MIRRSSPTRSPMAAKKQLKPCSPGKIRDPETGRCKKDPSIKPPLKPCSPGKIRDPETGRCKKDPSIKPPLKPCSPGKIRDPETGRCKKDPSSAVNAPPLKPCKEGQIRNPNTNRCVKDTVANRLKAAAPPSPKVVLTPPCPPGTLVSKDGKKCIKDTNAARARLGLDPKSPRKGSKSKKNKGENPFGFGGAEAGGDDGDEDGKVVVRGKKKMDILYVTPAPQGQTLQEYVAESGGFTTEECIGRSALPVREHQRRVVNHLINHRGIVAAFGVGTGKTLTAVVTSQCLLDSRIVSKVIVVTPKSLVENFKKEMRAYGVDPKDPRYEFHTQDGFTRVYPAPDKSIGCDDSLLIVDEAHELRTQIKNKKSGEGGIEGKKAYDFVNCALRAKRVLLLTATPFYNRESDIVNLVSMVRGEVIKSLPKKKEEKENLLRNVFTFFNLPEGSSDIPNSNVSYQKLVMSPAYYEKYNEIENNQNIDWTNPRVFLSGLRRATNSLMPNPKADWTVDRIVTLGLKTVVYSAFIASGVRVIQEALEARGIPFVSVIGEMSAADRKAAVDAYNKNEVRVLFISRAGGVGLDLKGTREVILLESSWSKAQEDQVIGRAIRIGSHTHLPPSQRHVEVHHLILQKPPLDKRKPGDNFGSADEILQELVEEKAQSESSVIEMIKSLALE